MMQQQEHVLLVHYSEIGLKGRNQPQFRRQLRDNIQKVLRRAGLDWPVTESHGHLTVPVPAPAADQVELAISKIRDVFGVAWIADAKRVPHQGFRDDLETDLRGVQTNLIELANRSYRGNQTFVVRVNRADKSLPFTSPKLEAELGQIVRDHTPWNTVSLKKPDLVFNIDISRKSSLFFSEKVKGPNGLPVGSSGRVLVLLSGGIDSAVAAYLMAKRGCQVDFLHFTATSTQHDQAREEKVWQIAQHLTRYTLNSRLYLAPYLNFDVALFGREVDYDLILFRRFMARVGERLAKRAKAQALVTGDNLSQVASQTLSNLVSASQSVKLPVLRPLLCFNKEEIIELAERIGTYQESIKPYKDCCAIIARHPRTRSKHEQLADIEDKVFASYPKLIDQTLAETVCFELPER